MPDNGNKEEEKVKTCPFLNKYCITDRCTLYTEMMRNTGGSQEKFGMCSFNATLMILSEINMKTQPPHHQIQVPDPGLFRG